MNRDRTKTLDEIEGVVWGPPEYHSGLVTTCHRLRTKPLQELTPRDLCVLLNQRISTAILAPLAMDFLEADPLAAGDYYPGALLLALGHAREGWLTDLDAVRRVARLLDSASLALEERSAPDYAGPLEWVSERVKLRLVESIARLRETVARVRG